jgi:dipeptidyl aminopeptidase/acylaminoacyl peptidase
MVRLLGTDHLNDQLAALAWLRMQSFVDPDRVAVAGNSFGGIEVVLGTEKDATEMEPCKIRGTTKPRTHAPG